MESIYLKVTRDFTPSGREARFGGKDSAITVEKGDIIFDVRKDDDGWLCGKNLNSGKTGRFPSDCVSSLSEDKTKTTDKKDSTFTKNPQTLSSDTKATERTVAEPTGSLRRPPNPRPFGLSSRYPRTYDQREKKESSGDSGVGVEDGEDYYLNDNLPEKKKPPDSRKISPTESETKKPSIYESRFGNSKTYSPIYSTRPSVSKLKSAFLENDQKAKATDMKGKDKPKESIEMTKKPSLSSEPKDKDKKTGKAALAAEEDDNDGMYASAEIDGKPSDVNKNKKADTLKQGKDKKVNIQDNPLSKDKGAPYHSYQVPQGPEKPPRNGGCSECDEPHIYADPAAGGEHYTEPEGTSAKYDFDPTERQQQKLLEKTNDEANSETNRRSYNRMASYESISNVGPDKNTTKARSTESIKEAMKAVKKTKQKLAASPDKYPRIRIIVGTLLGIFLGVFVFFLFYLVIPLHVILAIVCGIIIGVVFALILGFLDRKRLLCIILLIFPSIFATRGKIALWILILYFLIAGPLCNFIGNVNIIALSYGQCWYNGAESNTSGNGSNEVDHSYQRVVHPLLQRYVDKIDELRVLVNLTSTRWDNITTLQTICDTLTDKLRNNCISLSHSAYIECMHDSKNPKILDGCQTLKPKIVCDKSNDNFTGTCIKDVSDFVTSLRKTLNEAPGHAMLTAYKYDSQPTLATPAKKKCENGVTVLTMLLPLLILLVLYEAYSYHKLYLARNDFDNQYLTNHFKTIEDTRKASGSTDGLLPLKKCEHQRYIQPTSPQFTIAERNNMLKYLLVYFIFLVFALILILGDYYLYHIITTTKDGNDGSSMQSTSSTVQSTSSSDNSTNATNATPTNATPTIIGSVVCTPLVLPLGQYYVIVISVLLGLLLLMILIQAYVLRLRHYIASHLYRRRERKRIAYVYYKLLEERKAFYKAVIDNINMESEENYAMDQLDAVRVLAWNFQTMEKVFSLLGISLRNCMVCGRGLNRQYIYCDTDTCESIYCRTCFWDLGNKCLGCMRDSNPVTRSSSFIQGSSRKRKVDNAQGV